MEINDSLQGITVSSLNVEKDKKLVTWRDTVKAQPKVTPSVSLTTSSSNIKRRVVPNTNEREADALKASVRVPSLGKVTRSRILMEKLNQFVCTKNTEVVQADHTDSAEEIEEKSSENTFSTKKEKSAADSEYNNDDAVLEDMGIEEALDLSVLTHISEEGEIEDVSSKFSTNISAKIVHKKTVSFAADCPLNVTQDIERSVDTEENEKLKLTNQESSSNKYDISSSEDEEGRAKSADNEDERDDSDDETKAENTSSLCLRLPLEGMESEVMLRNKDLDPDQKLKKNIKSFYELMKARRCKVITTTEQPSVLESSSNLQLLVASPKEQTVSPISSGTSLVEKHEVNDVSERVFGELAPKTSRENLETATAFDSSKKVTFKIASRQPRTWKRRKKLRKCRMCVRCFMRKVRSRRDVRWWYQTSSTEEIEGFDVLSSYDNESVPDSSQILLQDPLEQIPESYGVRESFSRKSQSTGCLVAQTTRKKCYSKKSSMAKTFRSLPNIHMDCTTSNSYKLSANNSFDNVIPRKRRKISASYLDRVSGDEGCMVQANLRQNISKIRQKKKEVELPLILDYEKVGLSEGKIIPADILYVNEVFEAPMSPERSELDSVNIGEYDGIKEYGDEELDGWEAAEEELLNVPEQNKLSTTFESPTRLSRPKTDTLVDPETDIKMDCLKIDGVESTKTLKNSSGCTIVNEASKETAPVKSGSVADMIEGPTVPEDTAISPGKTSPVGGKTIGDKIPCLLPRIIPQNNQTSPLRSLMGPAHGALKLPDIRAHKDFEVNKLTMDKLVQVPSNRAIASASFSQQTSAIFLNACTSFNREDFTEILQEQSSTTPTTPTQYDPFERAHLQLLELIEDDNGSLTTSPMSTLSALSTPTVDFRPFVTARTTPETAPKKTDDASCGKRASVIDPPHGFQDARASRDLDQEFELLESLMNNNLHESSERPGVGTSLGRRVDPGDEIYVIDPSLINEHDNLSIPERMPSDAHSPVCNDGRARRRPTQLSVKPTARSLPLIRPDQVRLAPDGSSAESQTGEGRRGSPGGYSTKIKTKSKMRIDFSPELQRNKNNRRLGTSSLSKHAGLELKKALSEKKEDISPKEEIFNINRTPTAEELYPDNPQMYEEFRKYEEMYRREKEGRSSSSKKQKKTADFGINIEESTKTYGDSAYGSLNRKQQMEEHENTDQLKEFGANKRSNATTPIERLPKFCHECGNRYPVATAKFCVECGVRRLVL